MVRLYPDAETESKLRHLERDCRRAWNWMVKQVEEVLEARSAYAIRNGLVGPRPVRPDYDGLEPDAAKEAKTRHRDAVAEWSGAVHHATKDDPACQFRKFKETCDFYGERHDYQMLGRVIDWFYDDMEDRGQPVVRPVRPCAHLLQSLAKNYFTKSTGARRKRFRRAGDTMPLQVRSGDCFRLGDFGGRGRTHAGRDRNDSAPFYDCLVTFNGLRIRGRLPGRIPAGRVLEGVSIRRLADGWWASIKQEVPIRIPDAVVPGSVVGIDVGLVNVAAISEVRVATEGARVFADQPVVPDRKAVVVDNRRGASFVAAIAARQAVKKPVGRLQLRASRHTLHRIYNEVVKPLHDVETIKVERLVSTIGQMGSSKVSVMRTITELLRRRYGDRVREVAPHYTSQDCSQCGFRSKESWSYEHGRRGHCPSCGYQEDRDINAARNIAFKQPLPLTI